MSKLGLRSARKLTLAGIKINLIELRSCEFRQKLALPELKKEELRTTLYAVAPPITFGWGGQLAGLQLIYNINYYEKAKSIHSIQG